MRRLTMPLKQRRATPHRLIAKTTKALFLVLCLAVLPVGCSSTSRLQNFPEPPQVFGGTLMNIIYPDGMYMRPLGIAGDFGAFGGSSNDKAMALLMLAPIVLPAIIVDIPLSPAADVVFLPVSIPAELWWYSVNKPVFE